MRDHPPLAFNTLGHNCTVITLNTNLNAQVRELGELAKAPKTALKVIVVQGSERNIEKHVCNSPPACEDANRLRVSSA